MSEEMRELDLDDLEKAAGGIKVRLLQDMPGKGSAGDLLEVSDGYAKNYLIPKGLAEIPTVESLTKKKSKEDYLEADRRERQMRMEQDRMQREKERAERRAREEQERKARILEQVRKWR